jgi:hypothetical protein
LKKKKVCLAETERKLRGLGESVICKKIRVRKSQGRKLSHLRKVH